jgi:hypothetical protein
MMAVSPSRTSAAIDGLVGFDQVIGQRPIIDAFGQSAFEADFVGSAIGGADVVGVRIDVFVVVGIAPFHRDFDLDGIDGVGEIDDLAERGFVLGHRSDVFA